MVDATYFAGSEALEEREQPVRWAVVSWLDVRERGAVYRPAFKFHVGVHVFVGGVEGFMAEPQCDRGDINRLRNTEQLHRRGMSKNMKDDGFHGQRRTLGTGGDDVLDDESPDPNAHQMNTSAAGKQWTIGFAVEFTQPHP